MSDHVPHQAPPIDHFQWNQKVLCPSYGCTSTFSSGLGNPKKNGKVCKSTVINITCLPFLVVPPDVVSYLSSSFPTDLHSLPPRLCLFVCKALKVVPQSWLVMSEYLNVMLPFSRSHWIWLWVNLYFYSYCSSYYVLSIIPSIQTFMFINYNNMFICLLYWSRKTI